LEDLVVLLNYCMVGFSRTFVARGVLDGEEGGKLVFAGARELFSGCHSVGSKCSVWFVAAV
jgi:hypothetical protein